MILQLEPLFGIHLLRGFSWRPSFMLHPLLISFDFSNSSLLEQRPSFLRHFRFFRFGLLHHFLTFANIKPVPKLMTLCLQSRILSSSNVPLEASGLGVMQLIGVALAMPYYITCTNSTI